jgi:hypothetical protein
MRNADCVSIALALLLFSFVGSRADGPAPLQPIEPIEDERFQQEYREEFIAWDQPANSWRIEVAFDSSGSLWAAGPWGVRRLADGKWHAPRGIDIDGPAFSLAPEKDTIWVAAWNGLYQLTDGELSRDSFSAKPLGLVRHTGGRLFAGGPDGLWENFAGDWRLVPGQHWRSLTDVSVINNSLWIATLGGLFELREGKARRLLDPHDISSGHVRTLAAATDGTLWIGSSNGIDLYEKGRRIRRLGGEQGLPCTDVRRLRFDDNDVLWAATERGLGRFTDGRWTWRHSLRWLPGDAVRDVAFAPDATAYVATTAGLAILKIKPITLAEKSDHYEQLVRARHVRPPGLVERCLLKEQGDLSSHAPMDSDNDGLFTALYVGAESLRFAVTGDVDAALDARENYRALEFLQTVTDTSGFVARSVIPSEWGGLDHRNETYTPQQLAALRLADPRFKPVENRWRTSRDGKWFWKGDTSSDEITGHYFAYALYFDHVANVDEKRRVARHVRRITDYIIDGGFTLRDIDGQPTRWGVWSPERLKNDPDWQPERGCNAVEILSFLAVANHITGDEKYLRHLIRLFDDEGYGDLILDPKVAHPSGYTYIDDQLLALSYRGLLAYDRDSNRRVTYLKSVRRWFDVVRRDHSPLYAFVYAGACGGEFGANGCIDFLRDSPLDMIDWTVDNRGREDVRIVRRPVLEAVQVDRLLPPSERGLNKWDDNPYLAVQGSDGRSESTGVHWLLPYWLGRHYGIIK